MRTNGKTTNPATAALLALVLLAGCASGGANEMLAPRPEPVQPEGPLAAVQQPEVVTIDAIEVAQDEDAARIEIQTSEALVWTTYRDGDDRLVIELPNSQPGAAVGDLDLDSGLVRSIQVSRDDSGKRSLTRIVVGASGVADHSVSASTGGVVVELGAPAALASLAGGSAAPAAAPEAPVVEDVWEEAVEPEVAAETTVWEAEQSAEVQPEAAVEEAPTPWVEEAPMAVAATGRAATELRDIDVVRVDDSVVVRILGDGEFSYQTLSLEAPYRYVVDLAGVANFAPQSVYNANGEPVEKVRVAQFKSQPDLVSRVVIDLAYPANPELVGLPDGLALSFGGTAAAAWSESATMVDDVSAAVPPQVYEEAPPAYAGDPSVPATDYAATGSAGSVVVDDEYVEADQYAAAAMVQEPAPMVEESEYGQPAAPSMPEAVAAPINVKLVEPAAEPAPGELFNSKQNAAPGGGKVYRGEPITVRLKEADIRDLLRSFSEFSGLNFVIQPGVRGTVTVELVDVPWDQALDLILKTNDLGYSLEGNILRIAPLSKLREEAEAEQALRAAQAQAVPLATIIKRVSYATAQEVASVLRSGSNSVLSRRGTVIVDARTNTLIIKELPDYIDTVIAVIETLDIPEPQVLIEARIIETTKRFSRTLGINWGFAGVSSAATGNTTGLVFPNNGTVQGGVELTQAGNGNLGITLGNVLNTFQLDVALQAAENEGLINILSAPRITTLNNQSAQIQSGLQIPIQTVANNTVSVQFVNATLSLQVTPHVTAEGTVLMDIAIQKREPLLAFAVTGAANAPISTKDASTKVIVHDGGTTVIGGIYQVSSDEGQDKVPGLSKVPLLKHLFRNNRQSEENEELLIFITPRVVNL
jgi:type IV pilus assembly protein PilQ